MAKQLSKKDKMIRGVALALGFGAVATGGYYGYKAVDKAVKQKRELEAARQRDIQAALTASQTAAAAAQRAASAANRLPAATASGFPISRGAQGDMVRQLQEGLAKNYPAAAAILNPVRSQFGTFGPTTERALAAAGFATTVSEADFKKITGQGGGAGPQVQADSETRQRFRQMATTLRTRFESKGVFDIDSANRDIFNKIGGTDQNWRDFNSIYNAIYGGDALMKDLQKYNNSNIANLGRLNWHINTLKGALADVVSGLLGTGHQLYTMMETLVRDENGKVYEVPANSLIGTELASRDGLLVFSDPNGRMGLVDANAVAYL